MIESVQFVPGWMDFTLNNGLKPDIMVARKGLEAHTFSECYEMATNAEIENIKIPFLHIKPAYWL